MIDDYWNANTPNFYSVLWPWTGKIKWQIWPLCDRHLTVCICKFYWYHLTQFLKAWHTYGETITKICTKTLNIIFNRNWDSYVSGGLTCSFNNPIRKYIILTVVLKCNLGNIKYICHVIDLECASCSTRMVTIVIFYVHNLWYIIHIHESWCFSFLALIDVLMIDDYWNTNTPDFHTVLWPGKIKWQIWPLCDTSEFVHVNCIGATYFHSLKSDIYIYTNGDKFSIMGTLCLKCYNLVMLHCTWYRLINIGTIWLYLNYWSPDWYIFLHMPWQHSCLKMCKILLWLLYFDESKFKFKFSLNFEIKKWLVKQALNDTATTYAWTNLLVKANRKLLMKDIWQSSTHFNLKKFHICELNIHNEVLKHLTTDIGFIWNVPSLQRFFWYSYA